MVCTVCVLEQFDNNIKLTHCHKNIPLFAKAKRIKTKQKRIEKHVTVYLIKKNVGAFFVVVACF